MSINSTSSIPVNAVLVEQSVDRPLVNQPPGLRWEYTSVNAGIACVAMSVVSILFAYLLMVAYPDAMPGPVWLVTFFAYTPFLVANIWQRSCYTQIYLVSLVVIGTVWLLIPSQVGLSAMVGLPFALGFWIMTAGLSHLWQVARPGVVDMLWVARYLCLWTTCAFTSSSVYGILVSFPIQLYRIPFILQPISVLGYSALEALVMFANCMFALFAVSFIREPAASWRQRTRPLQYLAITLSVWLIVSGIIWGSNKAVNEITVAALPKIEKISLLDKAFARAVGAGVKFVVLPECNIAIEAAGFPSCADMVKRAVGPLAIKHGLFATVGCCDVSDEECGLKNMAVTISPKGEVVSVYGKMRPTPGETSCSQPGYFANPIPATSLMSTGGPADLKFAPLICYDMDYSGPAAEVADLGASLIVNPSNDWKQVRHHFAASVMKAVENRVAVVKSESSIDAAIISPWGSIVALGGSVEGSDTFIVGKVPLMAPFKLNIVRQQFVHWSIVAGLLFFTLFDIYTVVRKRRESRATGTQAEVVGLIM